MQQRKKFEHVSSRPLPYTTKTGIQIGKYYEPPLQQPTREGEFIQSVLLGNTHSIYPHKPSIWMVLYTIAMVGLLFIIARVLIV